jgi:hypothetical protein
MATTVFVSPGVYTREQDFTFFASRIGITRLGMVGLTTKGPAFEPIKIPSQESFLFRFGGTNPEYPLPYVANAFLGQSSELTMTRVLGKQGFTNSSAWLMTSNNDDSTLVVIRSKYDYNLNSFIYTSSASSASNGLNISTSPANPLATFTISGGSATPLSAYTNGLTVTLDESQKSYIVNALGTTPINTAGDLGLFVDIITPHFIRQAYSAGTLTAVNGFTFIESTSPDYAGYTDYTEAYKNSTTPMIVSKVIGSSVRDMFYFETISDGNASANEIKISIANIDDINKVFDVVVRKFDDTDANTLTNGRLELYRGLTMDDTQPNFVGKAIGTTDETYPRQSQYVTVTFADNFPRNTVPAGFKGYYLRENPDNSIIPANLLYKTGYTATDTVSKTYLGISELAYTLFTPELVGRKLSIQSIEKDIFKNQGATTTGTSQILGFHMESGATSAEFVTGVKGSISDYTKSQAKFTVVPAGGFDGWNQFRMPTFTDDAVDAFNVQAFKDAIDLMSIPETVDVNLFATPDCNWLDHYGVVEYGISMVENRADAVYIIDAPRYASDGSQDSAAIATDLQGTGIDSNYSATYWPWIQIFDASYQQFVFTSPTAQVVKSIALTDNIAYPWFAPAGLTRGKVDCVKADVKLTRDDRDNLYDVNINPINTTISEGVTIQGQKTLQVKQSALDRINVRRLLLQVRRLIAAASQTLLFEPNDQTVRDQFLAKVEPLLLQIQNQRGLAAFRVVVDDFNTASVDSDRNTLTGKIQIKPTPALEFIDLTFQVLPTGANFEDF